MTISIAKTNDTRSIFSHWAWVVPVLLCVSSMTLYQADLVPPSFDEWMTIYSSGWLGYVGESPAEFLQSLFQTKVGNMPGYNLLLSAWGSLTAYKIAMARVLGILLHLLTLSLVYRLARDTVAPVAGLLAVVIVVSSAFFNFYIALARPYTLFVLMSCVTIWLYLRLVHRRDAPRNRDLVSLGAAVFALVMAHLFSATLLLTLGLYHLIFVPKNHRWLKFALTVVIPIVICLPMVGLVLSDYSTASSHLLNNVTSGVVAVNLWLNVMLNNQPLPLLILIAAGIILGIRQRLIRYQPWFTLPALFLVTIAFLGQYTQLITPTTMRHQLDGWILLVLCAAASLYAFFKWKRVLGLLILLWLLSGYTFQQSANWWNILAYRAASFWLPPSQLISRLAQEQTRKPYILSYPFIELYHQSLLPVAVTGFATEVSQRQHYFSQNGIGVGVPQNMDELVEQLQNQTLHSPTVWHIYQKPLAQAEDLSEAAEAIRGMQYEFCEEQSLGLNTIINHYSWDLLDCRPPVNPAAYQTEFIEYELFKMGLNADKDAVLFIDRWTPLQNFNTPSYNMSYQLVSEDWNNVAQLDLPMVHEAELRQFSIDISQVPPGQYQLMLILYHKITGDRFVWEDNPGYAPEMLELGSITIPVS